MHKLEADEKAARDALLKAQNNLAKGYTDAALKIIQLYFSAISKTDAINAVSTIKGLNDENLKDLNLSLKAAGQTLINSSAFTTLCQAQVSCMENQTALTIASEAYMRAKMASEMASVNDGGNLLRLVEVENQIDSLTMDIQYYQNILGQSTNALDVDINVNTKTKLEKNGQKNNKDPEERVPTNISLPSQDKGASIWQEIILDYKSNAEAKTNVQSASVSQENFQTSLWFVSVGASQDTATASSTHTHSTKDTNIKIGFRVMKVAIQRPWMDGGLLGETVDFYREGDTKISKGDPGKIKTQMNSFTDLNSKIEILPSWPTGFVVAKDVHIIFTTTSTFDSSFVTDMRSATTTGGGVLCFSCSKSTSSSDHREGAVITSTATSVSIKIPAPQIIGWISELAPDDSTQKQYNAFADDEFKKEQPTPEPVKPTT